MSPRGKAATALRTIGEVARELDLDTHVLRFWESKFPQVKPVRGSGNRRYYRPEDIDHLRKIRGLLHEEGYTIDGALRLLRSAPVVAPRDGRETIRQAVKELEEVRRLLVRVT